MEISTVLFDLDGTITDSGSGIINSVKYALKKAGRKIPPEDELRKFIGPPISKFEICQYISRYIFII